MMEAGLDKRTFRRTMGLFGTGVTVISSKVEADIHAMTANAFTSVSLDPPLILVCLNRGSKMESFLRKGSHFAVNFLSSDQEPLSRHFAGGHGNKNAPSVEFISWSKTPRLTNCLGAVACEVHTTFDAGDHEIVVGKVEDIYLDDAEKRPLLFWKGQYHALSEPCIADN